MYPVALWQSSTQQRPGRSAQKKAHFYAFADSGVTSVCDPVQFVASGAGDVLHVSFDDEIASIRRGSLRVNPCFDSDGVWILKIVRAWDAHVATITVERQHAVCGRRRCHRQAVN